MSETPFEKSAKNQTSSAGRLFGRSVIYGKEDEANTPYMTRYWIGRLRLHIFYRGDHDPDCHDHPWDFWTFPLTAYVEEVDTALVNLDGSSQRHRQVVPAWHLTFRPAEHCHRVLGRYTGFIKGKNTGMVWPYDDIDSLNTYSKALVPQFDDRKIITLVWRGKERRKWGFLKHRDGRWCWIHWKEYVFGGGKSAPCE